ncbi:hypothetical protein LzC2_38050 [Planctomycetes bacterium LzC2]|uniref:Uncharacterized protein n=1 Tax=Alienimonas chondri TaxID=2681879 RepID=A0ABX1VIW0_9PLAN|nr:hypothetical protein [Alienimonas chondri]
MPRRTVQQDLIPLNPQTAASPAPVHAGFLQGDVQQHVAAGRIGVRHVALVRPPRRRRFLSGGRGRRIALRGAGRLLVRPGHPVRLAVLILGRFRGLGAGGLPRSGDLGGASEEGGGEAPVANVVHRELVRSGVRRGRFLRFHELAGELEVGVVLGSTARPGPLGVELGGTGGVQFRQGLVLNLGTSLVHLGEPIRDVGPHESAATPTADQPGPDVFAAARASHVAGGSAGAGGSVLRTGPGAGLRSGADGRVSHARRGEESKRPPPD